MNHIEPLSLAVVASRAPTVCQHCGDPIPPGEPHARRDFRVNGARRVARRHGECEAAMGAVAPGAVIPYVPHGMVRGGTVPRPPPPLPGGA